MHHWDVGLCEPAQKPYHPSHFQNYALHMHKLIAIHNAFLYDICRNDYRLINSVGAPCCLTRGRPRRDAPTELAHYFLCGSSLRRCQTLQVEPEQVAPDASFGPTSRLTFQKLARRHLEIFVAVRSSGC